MTYMKGRATLYKGVKMRSRLEADFAGFMDRAGTRWKYEPDCFASDQGQWLPDFRIWQRGDDDPAGILVELKPAQLLKPAKGEDAADVVERIDAILKRTEIAYLSEPDTPVNLIFWTWGKPGADLLITGTAAAAYHAIIPGCPLPMLWPGMSQQAITDAFAEECVRLRREKASA